MRKRKEIDVGVLQKTYQHLRRQEKYEEGRQEILMRHEDIWGFICSASRNCHVGSLHELCQQERQAKGSSDGLTERKTSTSNREVLEKHSQC